MILLQAFNLKKFYGANLIFDNISFIIEEGERIALVGPNGVGKTTLLKCLVGEELPDGGSVTMARKINFGYLAQVIAIEELDINVFDFVLEAFQDLILLRTELRNTEKLMSKPDIYNNEAKLAKVMKLYDELTIRYELEGGYTYEARTKEILMGLGFHEGDWERSVATFSGGQKTRLGLARLLAREPELLILDEPTNYLDLQSLNWLENHLKQYRGAVLVVSHDRYFLDAIATKILDLDQGALKEYSGNYSQYAMKKAQAEAIAKKAYELQAIRIQRLEAYVEKYRAGIKSKQARGRERQLQKIIPLTRPKYQVAAKMNFAQSEMSGQQVLTVKDLSFSYSGNKLFNDLSFNINQGDRIALIGDNGTGKTTLIKLILNELSPEKGEINFGARVKSAYFSQERADLDLNNTVLEEILATKFLTIESAKNYLARYLFRSDDLDKKTRDLSGGEQNRLALAKLMLIETNFLILDEPTNHLDMETRQVLEDTLASFTGTIFMVSHDRYFINQIANQIWELKNKEIETFLGDYDYYLWKKEEIRLEKEKEEYLKKVIAKKPKLKKAKVVQKKKLDPAKIEEEILNKEERLEELAILLGSQELYKNTEQLLQTQQEYNDLEQEIEELYESWSMAAEEGSQ